MEVEIQPRGCKWVIIILHSHFADTDELILLTLCSVIQRCNAVGIQRHSVQ